MPKKRKQYSQESLSAALEAVKKGMPVRKAEEKARKAEENERKRKEKEDERLSRAGRWPASMSADIPPKKGKLSVIPQSDAGLLTSSTRPNCTQRELMVLTAVTLTLIDAAFVFEL